MIGNLIRPRTQRRQRTHRSPKLGNQRRILGLLGDHGRQVSHVLLHGKLGKQGAVEAHDHGLVDEARAAAHAEVLPHALAAGQQARLGEEAHDGGEEGVGVGGRRQRLGELLVDAADGGDAVLEGLGLVVGPVGGVLGEVGGAEAEEGVGEEVVLPGCVSYKTSEEKTHETWP